MKPRWVRKMASGRVESLVELAKTEKNESRRQRYIDLARKTALKYKVELPRDVKTKICKRCGTYLIPGRTLTVRARPKSRIILYTCKNCGKTQKYSYARENRQKINKGKNT